MSLNDWPLATLELSSGWSEHEIAISQAAWSRGVNILYLEFGRTTVPARLGGASQEQRSLSAAFDYLQVEMVD